MNIHNNIDFNNFSVNNINVSEIDKVVAWLPTSGAFDLNIAEEGLVLTLGALNFCQDKIFLLERWAGHLESEKNRSWSKAAIDKAKAAGHSTIKLREWFAQADDDYIQVCNQLTMAKALKRWFDNKADYFSSWHYAFKTFLKRDYSIEKMSNIGYNNDMGSSRPVSQNQNGNDNFGGEYKWDNE
jgi:hypothetical protein